MKRYSIFFDFDDTIVETKHLVAQYLNNKYGVCLTTETLTDNDEFDRTLKNFGVNVDGNELYVDFGKNFFQNHRVQDFKLYTDTKEVIINLSRIYNLYITTSRQGSEKGAIESILKHNEILSYFQDIHCVWNFNGSVFSSIPKSSFIAKTRGKEIPIGFIDDSLKEVLDVVKKRCVTTPSLFDPHRKYQREANGFEIFRSWRQIERMFS